MSVGKPAIGVRVPWSLVAALAAPLPTVAMADAAPWNDAARQRELSVLLDTDEATADRREALQRLEAAAARGDERAVYYLASLYRQGGRRFAGVLEIDLGRALPGLIAGARGGELAAFAKIAEAYDRLGEPQEALA
jgi:hypothetical protein